MEIIYVENGILNQVKKDCYYTGIVTKKEVFNYSMELCKEFYKKYPYAVKWDYEKFFRTLLEYYD